MKDLPHHVKQLNKKVLRSLKHEQEEVDSFEKNFRRDETGKQKKKKAKQEQKKSHEQRPADSLSTDEQNKLMKDRTPVIRKTSHHPRPSK